MFNLSDIIQAAQGGQAMANVAMQYQISRQQAQDAITALLPAFALGLQRQTRTPDTLGALFGQMASARHIEAYDNPTAAFGRQAMQQGEELLRMMFGSHDLSARVANQAAALSGVHPDVVQIMMPALAMMLLGGLSRTVGATADQPVNPADFVARIMGSIPGSALGTGMVSWAGMPGPLSAQPPDTRARAPSGAPGETGAPMMVVNPFAQILAAMAAGSGEKPAPAPPAATDLGLDAFQQMFQTGRELQEQHLLNLQALFAAMPGPARRDD